MTRRDAAWMIARAAAVTGASRFFSPSARAADEYVPQFFSASEFHTLDAFTNILIPTDDTPGAREAQVTQFIDFVVNAAKEYAPEMQTKWRDAMGWLAGKHFGDLTPAEQLALLSSMAEPERDPAKRHDGFAVYRLIKDMSVRAFYTSRVGLTGVLEYKGNAYLTEFPACTHPEHRKVPV